jgi:phage terminase small subunit
MALNPRQTRFVKEYAANPNATRAAIRAGYSEKTARSQATIMFSKDSWG